MLLKRWHEILGHCNFNDVLKLEGVVNGIKISSKADFDCQVCALEKMTQLLNRDPDNKASAPLELIPITPIARDGFWHAVSFIDDYSGVVFLYFLRKKCDTPDLFKRFLAYVSPYGKVKRLRSDNGTEYTSAETQSVLVQHFIKHERFAPYLPHQNGTAERGWRTLFEMARCLLLESKILKEMRTYAVMPAAYIRNRCYNVRIGQTPFRLFTGQRSNPSNIHVFGIVCYSYEQNKA
jgi:hypothetical protein